jgi:PAS domain S-box-containing protein
MGRTRNGEAAGTGGERAAWLDQAHDAIHVRDRDHRITYWNTSAERLYGWPAAEAMGRRATDFVNADDYQQAHARLLDAGAWTGEFRATGKDGHALLVEAHWTLVRDADGRSSHCLAIEWDVTARRAREQQVLRGERLESIATLAGGIAHDLNNILTPITMAIEMLGASVQNEDDKDVLSILAASAARGKTMVSQVLSFARGGEGTRVHVQPAEIIADVARLARESFPKSIAVETHVPADLWLIEADPTRLHQVLLNLCLNARDAMRDGGTLTIRASNCRLETPRASAGSRMAGLAPFVVLEVEDTGCGIPRDVIEQIFDPFFTTKPVGKGTGLGLSTALTIVQGHGGFLSVQSEPGHGARFTVQLPALVDARLDDTAEIEPMPVGQGQLVLVVDDEPAIRRITQQTLESFGYRVLVAADGTDAVSQFTTRHADVDVVLMDMMMPELDGASAIRAFAGIDPSVPIVAVSGIAGNEAAARAAGGSVKGFLLKPYDASTVLKMLSRTLATR